MAQRLETLEELRDHLSGHLHVLVVLLSDSWGGLEQTALADTRRLVKNGMKVSFLVRDGSPVDHVLQQESPHIRRVHSPRKVRNWLDFQFMQQIRELVDVDGVNLVHLHQTSLLGSVVPALWGRRHVALAVSRHILNNHNKRDPLHALIYRRVDFLLVLSHTMRNNVVATFPVREKRVRTVNLGINVQRFNPNTVDRNVMRDEWGVAKDAFLVGVVGRLDPAKGQDVLVKALPRVAHDIPEVMGVLVGNETPGLEG
ncbi:MAG: glycosyltransferase family 4 protein, partial [Bdellovibrionales bacterium]|nr:glycosyltransferase family 4 protein [Bdellovibrionales bacterium]